jgi:5-methylcytosine-specific restriction endonuclease McrA
MSNVQNQQDSIYKSLQQFLFRKNLITQAVLAMARDSGLCQPSRRHGIVAIATAVDHIVPKHRGGTDDETNLEAISHMVHAAKTNAERNGQAWDEDEWFSQQGRGGQMSGAPGQ